MAPVALLELEACVHAHCTAFMVLLIRLLGDSRHYFSCCYVPWCTTCARTTLCPCSERYLSLLHLAVARARCRPVCTRLLRALGGTPCLDRAASLLPLQAYSLNACACNHLQPCLLCGVYPCVYMLGYLCKSVTDRGFAPIGDSCRSIVGRLPSLSGARVLRRHAELPA